MTVTAAADITAPNAPVITVPGAATYNASNAWPGRIAGTASDNVGGSGVAKTEVSIVDASGSYWNGTSFVGTTPIWLAATSSGTGNADWTYPYARPADGRYTVKARSTDAAGNVGVAPNGISSVVFTTDVTAPSVSDVVLANGAQSVAKKADAGDSVKITFSEKLDASKICSTWVNDGTSQSRTVTANLTQSGQSDTVDTVQVSGTGCAPINFGTVISGGNYLTGGSSATFASSTLTWDGTGALVLTLGGVPTSGTIGTNVIAGTPDYTPPAGLSDLAGNPLATTAVTSKLTSGF